MSDPISLAIIGGSGVYELPGLQQQTTFEPETPFGKPSAPIVVGELHGRRVAFLARHGIGHRFSPTEVPYRANVFALKMLGVERVLGVSACGSLREDYRPGEIVVPDQLYDHTLLRARSFFGEGLVGHLSAPLPFCPQFSEQVASALVATGATLHRGGTFITIEGPRFSTRAESALYRSWGMDLVGMTTSPEAFLVREAEMCYAVMAHVTDYDVWHQTEAAVTVETVVQVLSRNTEIVRRAVQALAEDLAGPRTCSCPDAMAGALITHPGSIPAQTLKKLGPLVTKYLPT